MKGLFGFGKKEEKKDAPLRGKWLVEYDRKGCIGAGTCEVMNPERWKVLDTRKAELKGSELNEQAQMFELMIGDDELKKMKEAADCCPKLVIHITNMETGEKVI